MRHQYHLRLAAIVLLALTAIGLFLFGVLRLLLPLIAWCVPQWEPAFYDMGAYGFYRSRTYVSTHLTSPELSVPQWDDRCDDGGYTLLTLRGDYVSTSGPTILDARGNLVWISDQFPHPMNFRMQRYNHQNYLTFWSGEKNGGQGKGLYYMLDSSYNVAYTVNAVGDDLAADLHEFNITPDGTALITIYNKTTADMTSIGRPKQGWIDDSVFQEIDIATNNLLFEWRASDHVDASESYMTSPLAGYWESIPFDFYHINAVSKDSHGNYLISSRHMHSVTCISPNGTTLWILGGKSNQFATLSSPASRTVFRWQHDARWLQEPDPVSGKGVLTLFDNQEGGVLHADGPHSRGLMLRVNVIKKTMEFVAEYVSLRHTRAPSQGSMQVLDSNVFVGWGHSAAFSEFDRNGTLLCESHFGPSWWDWVGMAVSYRAFRSREHEWVGKPESVPEAKLAQGRMYVSWNGATEVSGWSLEGQSDGDTKTREQWVELDVMKKEGFEDSFSLGHGKPRCERYRVAALDRNGAVMRYSVVVENDSSARWFQILAWALGWTGFVVCAWWFWRLTRRSSSWSWDWEWDLRQWRWRWPWPRGGNWEYRKVSNGVNLGEIT